MGQKVFTDESLKTLIDETRIYVDESASKKSDKTHTHNYAGSSSVGGAATSANKLNTNAGDSNTPVYFADGVPKACTSLDLNTSGNAASATKLQTNRRIGLTGAVITNSSVHFDGTSDQSIDIAWLKEAYLTWGGQNIKGNFSPLDAAMIPTLGANRLAFMPANAITAEYSRDGGATWVDYGADDTWKVGLFSGLSCAFKIGHDSTLGIDKSNYLVRITIDTKKGNVYTVLNKFAIYCSTEGSNGCYCTIDCRTHENFEAGKDEWKTYVDKTPIKGWSGWNIINTDGIVTYGNTASQWQQLRFTFGCTSHSTDVKYEGLRIYKILGFGGVGWSAPSNLAKYGMIYTYDASQNVTFPRNVSANKFIGTLEGDASKVQGTVSSTDSNRHVWFSISSDETIRGYNDNLMYNPAKNMMTTSITGNAETATKLVGQTATVTELNYCDGVTSNIQTQLDRHSESLNNNRAYTELVENQLGDYLSLKGGAITGQIIKDGVNSSWITGRDNAMIRMTGNLTGYAPAISIKTNNGSWEIGAYNSFADQLCFTYVTDGDYNSGTNNKTGQLKITSEGGITAGNIASSGYITCEERIKSQGTYDSTVTGDPNMRITNAYWTARTTSSSKRYKHDIKDLGTNESLNSENLLNIPVRQYIYNLDYVDKDDQRYNTEIPGFIAEEVYEHYPVAAEIADGKVEDWSYRMMLPPMLDLVQKLWKRVDKLETRVKELEK